MLFRSNTTKIDFFDLQYVLDILIDKITKLKTIINSNFIVYGELFGSINHPKKFKYKDEESTRLLKSDKVFFRAFDILIR